MKVCECRHVGCRSTFPMTHADYVLLTQAGQHVVAAGHVEHAKQRVVSVVCDGKAMVVEAKEKKQRVVRAKSPKPKVPTRSKFADDRAFIEARALHAGKRLTDDHVYWLDEGLSLDEIFDIAADMGEL